MVMATMLRSTVLAMASSRRPRDAARVKCRAAGMDEIGGARDHRVGRADAGDLDDLHPQAMLGPQSKLIGDVVRRAGEGEVRHRDDDVLHSAGCAARGGAASACRQGRGKDRTALAVRFIIARTRW